MSAITTAHIEIDENGVAWIDDTNVKVIEIIVDKFVHGSSPEEMHFQYPHLSLAQIHAALAYYYDHQTELEVEVERRWREANELSAKISDPFFRQRLLTLKKSLPGTKPSAKTFRKRKASDTWHSCRNCSSWPTSNYEERVFPGKTIGGFCNECKAKQKAGNCSQ